jgi:flagellar hook-associated protein 3 FlgL
MRVSNIGISTSAILGMQRAARAVEEAQRRTQTGLRVERPSDDPNAASSIMSSTGSLRALEQYTRNIHTATARINTEEEILDRVSQVLERAKQLGIQEGSSTASAQTRTVAKAEVDQILAFVVQLANTRHEGEYLFGGDQSATAPITQSTPPFTGAAPPPTGQRVTQVSGNLQVNATHNATQIFLNSSTLAALDELSVALGANDQPAIQASINTIDTALGKTQELLGDVGAQTVVLETTEQNLAALGTTIRVFKSNLEDADLEQAITHLLTRQNAYQAAMLATSRVVNLSLADYMR